MAGRSFMDIETGECIDNVVQIVTERQKKICHDQVVKKKQREMQPSFVWFFYNYGEAIFQDYDLASGTVARLFYMSTFCDYNGVLMSGNMPISKSIIYKWLGLSSKAFYNFWNEVTTKELIIENEDSSLQLNSRYFSKGKIKDEQEANFTRLYIKFIRNMYEGCDPRNHKILGYFFQLIPYVSGKYNFVCKNQSEFEQDKIIPLTVEEYCLCLAHDLTHGKRLVQQMLDFTVDNQHLMGIWGYSVNPLKNMLIINPNLFYGGDRLADIRGLFMESKKSH